MRSHNQLVLLDTTHHHPAAAADTAVDTMVAEGTADNTGHTVAEHNQTQQRKKIDILGVHMFPPLFQLDILGVHMFPPLFQLGLTLHSTN
ncbi:hypothetical protein Tco_0306673 [Tanacetum coccineum]